MNYSLIKPKKHGKKIVYRLGKTIVGQYERQSRRKESRFGFSETRRQFEQRLAEKSIGSSRAMNDPLNTWLGQLIAAILFLATGLAITVRSQPAPIQTPPMEVTDEIRN